MRFRTKDLAQAVFDDTVSDCVGSEREGWQTWKMILGSVRGEIDINGEILGGTYLMAREGRRGRASEFGMILRSVRYSPKEEENDWS